MAEPKKPFYRDKKWKLGRSFGWWHIPYCPHCKRQLGLMVKEQKAEKCPMCGNQLEWGGADMADCKWMQDEICVNADCPICADYCPVVDVPGVCRFEERSDDNG